MSRVWPFSTANALTWTKGTHATSLDGVGNGSYSLSFWFYLVGHVSTQQTFLSRYNGAGNLFRTSDTSPGKLSFFWIDTSLAGHDAKGATALAAATWYHALGVYNDTTHAGVVYLNGVQDGTASAGAIPIASGGSNTWNFGRREAPSFPLDGRMCEVAFWNQALTPAQALAIGKGASPVEFAFGLQAYWPIIGSGDSGVYYWGKDQDITKLTLVGSLATADHAPCANRMPYAA